MSTSPSVRNLDATAYKEGRWWMISIPEIDALSQATTIESVPAVAADLAAIVLNVPAEDVAVHISYRLPEAAVRAEEDWQHAKEDLSAAEAKVTDTLREYIRTLRGSGYTLKDIGQVTGYTFQRISQILKEA